MTSIASPRLDHDKRILLLVVVLMAIGASLVASSSSHFATYKFSDPYYLTKRHLVRIVIAGLFLALALRIDYRFYRKLSPIVFTVGIGLLAGLFLFGYTIRGTVSTYNLKALHLTLQPSEVARFSLVLFLAFWIERKGKDILDLKRGFVPPALAIVAVLGLMAAQPDYGSAAATTIIAFLMLFVGGARVSHLAMFASILTASGLVRILTSEQLQERFLANWQAFQSLVALGTGGLFGSGFGESRQKFSWLPDSHTDFIFSILGEEVGLLGTLVVSAIFLLIVLRALKLSTRSGDAFGEMLVIGLGSSVFVYAILNMFVAAGIFPVTGLPLPFVSYGGSALVVNAFSIGIILNVARKRPNGVSSRSSRRQN